MFELINTLRKPRAFMDKAFTSTSPAHRPQIPPPLSLNISISSSRLSSLPFTPCIDTPAIPIRPPRTIDTQAPAAPSVPVRTQMKIGPRFPTWPSEGGYKIGLLNATTVSNVLLSQERTRPDLGFRQETEEAVGRPGEESGIKLSVSRTTTGRARHVESAEQ